MTAFWPTDLNRSIAYGWAKIADNNIIPGTVDRGRRRYTKARQTYSVSMVLTEEQLARWESFWSNEILDGALPFTWKRPQDQIDTNFLSMATPHVQHIECGGDDATYRITMTLKEVPVS